MRHYVIVPLILLFAFISCDENKIITIRKKQPKKVSVFFLDRSISSAKGDEVEAKQSTALTKAIDEAVNQSQDEIWISYIYGETAIISNRKKWVFDAPLFETRGLSRREISEKQLEYDGVLKSYKKKFIEKILKDVTKIPSDQKETDVFGSIFHLEEIQSQYSDFDKVKIESHYFSDLKNCSKNIRKVCCDGVQTFTSYKKADELGAEDAKAIQEYYNTLPRPLKHISSIDVYLPTHEIDNDKGFIYLPTYYEQLFYNLGVSQVSFH